MDTAKIFSTAQNKQVSYYAKTTKTILIGKDEFKNILKKSKTS